MDRRRIWEIRLGEGGERSRENERFAIFRNWREEARVVCREPSTPQARQIVPQFSSCSVLPMETDAGVE